MRRGTSGKRGWRRARRNREEKEHNQDRGIPSRDASPRGQCALPTHRTHTPTTTPPPTTPCTPGRIAVGPSARGRRGGGGEGNWGVAHPLLDLSFSLHRHRHVVASLLGAGKRGEEERLKGREGERVSERVVASYMLISSPFGPSLTPPHLSPCFRFFLSSSSSPSSRSPFWRCSATTSRVCNVR